MKAIILPGYSISNKEWAEEVAKKLSDSRVHYWKHWDGETNFHPEVEAKEIIKEVGESKVNILAKSLGTYVLAILMAKEKISIDKIILCGIPLGDLKEKDPKIYNLAFSNFDSEKIICFQNSNDPHGSYVNASEFLKTINPKIEVIPKEASDHNYPYFKDFLAFLTKQ